MSQKPSINPDGIYLDDIEVGKRFRTGTYALDEEQIKTFAAQFDPQPFHLDNDAAKASLFQGLAASGFHTAAITMRLLVLDDLKVAGGFIGAGAEMSWPRPTRPTDVLHVEWEILEIKPSKSKPDRGIVTVKIETKNQNDEVVQLSINKIVMLRRPG